MDRIPKAINRFALHRGQNAHEWDDDGRRGSLVKCPGPLMTPKGTRTRRQRGSCGSSGQKLLTIACNEPATKAALSGKRTLWSRGRRKPATSGANLAFGTSSSLHEHAQATSQNGFWLANLR